MIHDGCWDNLSLRLTESAERMLLQEQRPSFTPAGVIPTSGGTAAHTVIAVHSVILCRSALKSAGAYFPFSIKSAVSSTPSSVFLNLMIS